jgi:hypothetical protein
MNKNEPKKESQKNMGGYPPYDDDKFYDIEQVSSAHDYTGMIPTPPQNESEAEAYSDLMNVPQPKGEVDNGLQRVRPQDVKKK